MPAHYPFKEGSTRQQREKHIKRCIAQEDCMPRTILVTERKP